MTREPICLKNGKWVVQDRKIVEIPSNNPDFPYYRRYKWYWRELPEKPQLDITGYPNTKFWIEQLGFYQYYFSKETHGYVCLECGKIRIDVSKKHGQDWWNNLLKSGKLTKGGDIIVYELILPDDDKIPRVSNEQRIIFTNRKFVHRDYCSEECYRKARKGKQKERRKDKREKKYAEKPLIERPDGLCKICGKDISDKRVGALTCCPAHRQKFQRLYNTKKK